MPQRDVDVQYNVAKNIFQSQANARQAINKALTAVVPDKFTASTGGTGQ